MPDGPNIFSMLYQKMNWVNHQFTTVSENIENANVPGWDQRVLQPLSFQKTMDAHSSNPMITHENHLQGHKESQSYKIAKDKMRSSTLSGNSVVIEEELQKLNEASIKHAEMTKLYKKLTEILKLPLRP
ncbi:flagellar basal body rod protein FlgB [Candidatus Bealeia paramacronuclearis]|uniref:Flagellar basal body rod protein FlgB n=1 Tax=Candidatus Bealeia paramacronuclearis TaxID=1921001 RepID=A0ABZ2C0Q1_9PROT|nr:flagellar basal body rod protein FlgB [Candidatus Bealeia paramacronuclearis]